VGAARTRLKSGVWCRLDKNKFFVNGAGLFSGVMACVVPAALLTYGAWPTPRSQHTTAAPN